MLSFLAGASVSAEPRHFRVFEEGLERGYALSFEASLHRAERTEFSRRIFLIAEDVDAIVATELAASADLELPIVPWLALELELPLSYRRADVRFGRVIVSNDEILPRKWLDLSGSGLADPKLAGLVRLLDTRSFALYARAGTTVPIDDNPGAPIVPSRVPLSTGQTELFFAARAALTLPDITLELDYRFGFHPGSAASYLTRTIDGQVANGALSYFWNHEVRAGARLFPGHAFSLGVFPEWRVDQNPRLVQENQDLAFLPESVRHELALEVRLSMRLSRYDTLELFYRHLLLDAWKQDPFFPIAVPAEGFGIAWKTGAP